MNIILEVVEGPESGRTATIEKGEQCIVGRITGQFILGNDPLISGKHLSITNTGRSAVLVDLESRNHVFIDGRQLDPSVPVTLKQDFVFRLGTNTVVSVSFEEKTVPVPREEPEDDVVTQSPLMDSETDDPAPNPIQAVEDEGNFSGDLFELQSPAAEHPAQKTPVPRSSHGKEKVHQSPFENLALDSSDPAPGTPIPSEAVDSSSPLSPDPDRSTDEPLTDVPVASKPATEIQRESNFTDSFYIPGNSQPKTGQSASSPSQPETATASRFAMRKIKFAQLKADKGLFVFGGNLQDDAEDPIALDVIHAFGKIGPTLLLGNASSTGTDEAESETDPDGPEQNDNSIPLFYWLPEELRSQAGPVMSPLESVTALDEIIEQQWGQNSLIFILGNSTEAMVEQLKSLVRINLITRKPTEEILGICWPNVLAGILDGMNPDTIQTVFGESIQAFLFEDANLEYQWKIYSNVDLSVQLKEIGWRQSASTSTENEEAK